MMAVAMRSKKEVRPQRGPQIAQVVQHAFMDGLSASLPVIGCIVVATSAFIFVRAPRR